MNMGGGGNGKGKSEFVMVSFLLALGWIGVGAGAAQEARSKAEVVPADTAKVSPGGASFTVPAGWSVEMAKDLEVLTPPETDTHRRRARYRSRPLTLEATGVA